MACDRFVYFPKSTPPTVEQIVTLAEDFLGGIGKVFVQENDPDRVYMTLPGSPTVAARSVVGNDAACLLRSERWVEIHRARKNVDVITRQQDTFTMGVADAFAELLERLFQGVSEDDD